MPVLDVAPLNPANRLGLNYRFTLRSSDNASREYTQNVVGLNLTYLMQ